MPDLRAAVETLLRAIDNGEFGEPRDWPDPARAREHGTAVRAALATPAEPMNAIEKLSREVARVMQLKEQYEHLRGGPQVSPAILIPIRGMEIDLETAHRAAGSNDAGEVLVALSKLEKWSE